MKKDIISELNNAKENGIHVVLYGAGELAENLGIKLYDWTGLKRDCVCDKNPEAAKAFKEKYCFGQIILLENLMAVSVETIVIVCVGVKYINEVASGLSGNKNLRVFSIDELCATDYVLKKAFADEEDFVQSSENKSIKPSQNSGKCLGNDSRIAIYTCITGGYESLKLPEYIEDNCDYFFISDQKPEKLGVYKYIDISSIDEIRKLSNKEKNRFCKMNAHKIFREYDYSIYYDGNFTVKGPVSKFINQIGVSGLALHRHPFRTCVYEEALRVMAIGIPGIDNAKVVKQFQRYKKEGMPRNYGLFECGVIVRDHNNIKANKVAEEWFSEYMRGEKRDQFSFTYILWKNGLKVSDIGLLNNGGTSRDNPDLEFLQEHK